MSNLETNVALEGIFRLEGSYKGDLLYEAEFPNAIKDDGASQARKGIVKQVNGNGDDYIEEASIYWRQIGISSAGEGYARSYGALGARGTIINTPVVTNHTGYSKIDYLFHWPKGTGALPGAADITDSSWDGYPESGGFTFGGYWWPPGRAYSGNPTGHANNYFYLNVWGSDDGLLLRSADRGGAGAVTFVRPTVDYPALAGDRPQINGQPLWAVCRLDDIRIFYTIKCSGLAEEGNKAILNHLKSPWTSGSSSDKAKVKMKVVQGDVEDTSLEEWQNVTTDYKTARLVAETPIIGTGYNQNESPTFQLISNNKVIAEQTPTNNTMEDYMGNKVRITWTLNLPRQT